jgi:hypothetical protein
MEGSEMKLKAILPPPTYTPYPTYVPTPTAITITPSLAISSTSDTMSTAAPVVDGRQLPRLKISSVSQDLPSYDRKDWRHWIDDDGDCKNRIPCLG